MNAGYEPWGSNYHDHRCLCPGCNPQPPDGGDEPCVTCGKPVEDGTACYCCGRSVHQNEPECGGWILDWWHPDAFDKDDGKEFWCLACLEQGREEMR